MAKPTTWYALRSAALAAEPTLQNTDLAPIYTNQNIFAELKAILASGDNDAWNAILDDTADLLGLTDKTRTALQAAWNS